jgi:hypothetical protein
MFSGAKVGVVRRFDAAALYRAMDEKRLAAGQSWNEVARGIGVSASTITRLRAGGRMEVDGMLAMVAWLGVPVEAFVRDGAGAKEPCNSGKQPEAVSPRRRST